MEHNFSELGLDSVDVAKALRYSGQCHNFRLNMTQINKLLYILYGAWLVRHSQRLTKESPAAWPYGPVFPRVHKNVALFQPIVDVEYNALMTEHNEVIEMMDAVVAKYGHLNAGTLSEWSHQKNGPWDIAVKSSKGKWNTKIADTDIYNYFFPFEIV